MNLFGADTGVDAARKPYPCALTLFSQLTGPIPTEIGKLSKLGKFLWFYSKVYCAHADFFLF